MIHKFYFWDKQTTAAVGAAAVVLLLLLCLLFSGVDASKSNFSSDSQDECINGFFSAIASQDEWTALTYVCNCDSLGIRGCDERYTPVYDELFSGLEWTIEEKNQLNSRCCEATVSVRALSVGDLLDKLSENVMTAYESRYIAPDEMDGLIESELSALSESFGEFYTERDIRMRLLFSEGSWKIVLDDSIDRLFTAG